MTVSVVIPAHDAAATLPELLAALAAQTLRAGEIVVADDRSSDDTAALAARHGVKRVEVPAPGGPGTARNAGVAATSGDLLLFLDADTVPPPDWIARMVATFAGEGAETVAIWGPYSEPRGAAPLARLQYFDIVWNQQPTPTYLEVVTSANLGVRREAFERAGGFPEMDVNEDYVFGCRLARLGRVRFEREIRVGHRFRDRWWAYFRQQRSWTRGVPEMYLRAPRLLAVPQSFRRQWILLDLALLGVAVAGLVAAPFWPWSLAPAAAAALGWNASGVPFRRFLAASGAAELPARRFHLVRNAAWLLGLGEGLLVALPRLLRRS